MTTFASPAIPLGFDSGLPEDASLNDYTLSQDMTADPLFFLTADDSHTLLSPHHWPLDHHAYFSQPPPDDARTPGLPGSSQHAAGTTVASSSRSPGSLVLTPVSTTDEDFYIGDAESRRGNYSDNALVSPASNVSPATDESFNLQYMGGADSQTMDPQHPFHNHQRQIPTSMQHSANSSVPQSSSRPSRASSVAPSDVASQNYWQSFAASTATSGAWINEQQPHHTQFYGPSNTFVLPDHHVATSTFSQSQLVAWDTIGVGPLSEYPFHQPSFRPFTSEEILQFSQIAMADPFPSFQQHPSQLSSLQVPRHMSQTDSHTHHHHHHADVSALHQYPGNVPTVPSQSRTRPLPLSRVETVKPSTSTTVKRRNTRKTVNETPSTVTKGRAQAASGQKAPRGGRQKDTHLPDSKRIIVSKMRKTGACWRCVLQRDPCPGDGTPCQRCVNRSHKGTLGFFPCDRTKLPDLILDFLPPSMTNHHSKQSIEDYVLQNVRQWDTTNGIDVSFSCGYGPPLKWRLYEFKPRDNDLLGQMFWGSKNGKLTRIEKYSPPFGLLKLDRSDDIQFEEYLDALMEPHILEEFAQTCFWEETEDHGEDFQAQLLGWICKLYVDNENNPDLGALLRKLIRMLIVTYIMGHTLTFKDETVEQVIASVKHSPHGIAGEFMSSRLSNRQFKFYFSMIRNNLYVEILNWLQQTLHSSGSKESTWLASFCVLLGTSMVLEELQRLLLIIADGNIARDGHPADAAWTEAMNACLRIDARHQLLVTLFQYKYRDKKWKNGSFGSGTPELRDEGEHQHVQWLYQLLVERRAHLQNRETIALHTDNQCLLTTRLIAQFLLPFLRQNGS